MLPLRLPLPVPPRPDLRLAARAPLKLLPQPFHGPLAAAALDRLLAEPQRLGDLDFLDGKVLQIEVTDLGLDLRLTREQGRLTAAARHRPPDVRFAGEAREFLHLALGKEDPDTLFFQRRLELGGDTELGLEIKNFLYSQGDDWLPSPLRALLERLLRHWPAA